MTNDAKTLIERMEALPIVRGGEELISKSVVLSIIREMSAEQPEARKDAEAGASAKTSEAFSDEVPASPAKLNESEEVRRDAWQAIFAAHFKYFEMRGIEKPYLPHDEIMEAIRPYLRQAEPSTQKAGDELPILSERLVNGECRETDDGA